MKTDVIFRLHRPRKDDICFSPAGLVLMPTDKHLPALKIYADERIADTTGRVGGQAQQVDAICKPGVIAQAKPIRFINR